MRMRFVPCLALLGLTLLPGVARPEAPKTTTPTIVLRVASIDSLSADVRYLSELAGREEDAKQFEAILKSKTGPKGLEGVDTKKPFGVYGNVGPMGIDSTAVVLLPIADEDAFLGLINKIIGTKPEKGDDGVYKVAVDNVPDPFYFRFANKYCYVTYRDEKVLAKDALLDPAVVLAGGKVGTLSATVNIDQIPENLRDMALGQIDLRLANLKEKEQPNETEAQKKLRAAVVEDLSGRLKALLSEGGAVELRLDLDRKAGDLSLSVSVAGKPSSKLAAHIRDLGQAKSLAASLVGKDSAMNGLLDVALPEELRAALGPVIDEGEKKALEEEKDKGKRELLAALLKAVKPTLKAGELDAGFDLRGPDASGVYTVVSGIKVKDGAAIDATLRKIIADLPKEQRDLIKVDFDKADKVAIHRITPDKVDEDTKNLIGDNPFYLAVRDDAVLLAGGAKGLEALKGALTAAPKVGRVAQFEMSVARVAPLMEKENKGAAEAAKQAFAKDKDADKLRITVEGGQSLRLRLAMKTQLVKFFSLVEQAKNAGQ
jgi:hypothetical protein